MKTDMRVQFRTVCISAHLDSLCAKLNDLCQGAFEFVYVDPDPGDSRRRIGWRVDTDYPSTPDDAAARARAEDCDLLVEMLREIPLLERRAAKGLKSVYVAERWFKPVNLFGYRHPTDGFIRLLSPGYFRMARRFVRLMENENFHLFPTGIVAARDFARLYGLFHGDWLCLFRAPKLKFERFAGGRVWSAAKNGASRYGLSRMRVWSYFVAPSAVARDGVDPTRGERSPAPPKKILWCGRLLDWKRVDVLIRAWQKLRETDGGVALLIVGEDYMLPILHRQAGAFATDGVTWTPGKVSFAPYQRQEKVRELMREADVYVMPSDGGEGWGATVSDALTEGCPVISTFEAGSSATLLPADHLYPAGDWRALARLLAWPVLPVAYRECDWSAEYAAARLLGVATAMSPSEGRAVPPEQ